jgi:hypothetical protein
MMIKKIELNHSDDNTYHNRSDEVDAIGGFNQLNHGGFIVSPNSNDILCGKDKRYEKHNGNLLFRSIIHSYVDSYCSVGHKKSKKSKIVIDILHLSKGKYGSRFLTPILTASDSVTGWKELNDHKIHDKISHALRYAMTKQIRGNDECSFRSCSTKTSTTSCTRTIRTKKTHVSSVAASTQSHETTNKDGKSDLVHQKQSNIVLSHSDIPEAIDLFQRTTADNNGECYSCQWEKDDELSMTIAPDGQNDVHYQEGSIHTVPSCDELASIHKLMLADDDIRIPTTVNITWSESNSVPDDICSHNRIHSDELNEILNAPLDDFNVDWSSDKLQL